jgi:hypothetical protein
MTPSEKQKAIAVAFSDFRYGYYPTGRAPEYLYDDWLLTEEGKRLTAEEPQNIEQTAIECVKDISRCMVMISENQSKLLDAQLIMDAKFDQLVRNLRGDL